MEELVFDIEKAKNDIKLLVDKYNNELSSGRLDSYSEEQTKNDFILRLFLALGWDVYNTHSKTLTLEEKASRGRVDFGFRINEIPKFFVEAKSFKAGVDKDEFSFQAINYAWSKGCTWAILTNFETIKIYNAEWKGRNAIDSQFLTLHCKRFLEEFDDLLLLSRDNMMKNLLDIRAEKYGKKTKKSPIDKQLLYDLTSFREILTKSIVGRNSAIKLSDEELDESVQKIIDRIIFIRTVEDREIEAPRLRPLIRENHNGNLWKKLVELYREFDNVYDSNLFASHVCDTLVIGDQELETMIRGLHQTHDGSIFYDFSAIDADVLGNVYEQYLGHILKHTKKTTKIQDGSSKRKEHGIYYTPTYVVDYIIRNTIGELIQKNQLDYKKIKIIDPSCGSGSFLLKALDYLLSFDSNLEETEKLKAELYGKHISTERFVYLKNCIYGVDLDTKAVEIAQLNLMLRSTERKERLPVLQQNIKQGNSLISDEKLSEFAFNWNEKFKDIMNNGGFHAVIGNPPYISSLLLTKSVSASVKDFWKKEYKSAQGSYDIFVLFFEQALRICREDGYVAFITPNKYLSSPYGLGLRDLISEKYTLVKIVDLSSVKVFDDPSVYPIITIIQKKKPENSYNFSVEKILSENIQKDKITRIISSKFLRVFPEYLWGPILIEKPEILERIFTKGEILEKVAEVQATTTAAEADEYSNYITEETGIPIINTGTIDRYATTYGLSSFRNKGSSLQKPLLDLTKIANDKRRKLYETPKIIIAKLALKIEAFLDDQGKYASMNTNCIHSPKKGYDLEYLLALINSKLMSFIYSGLFQGLRMSKGYYQYQAPQLRLLPIVKATAEKHDKLVSLVREMIKLQKTLVSLGSKITNERDNLQSKINEIESEINNIVYDIYEINEDDRKTIESYNDSNSEDKDIPLEE